MEGDWDAGVSCCLGMACHGHCALSSLSPASWRHFSWVWQRAGRLPLCLAQLVTSLVPQGVGWGVQMGQKWSQEDDWREDLQRW